MRSIIAFVSVICLASIQSAIADEDCISAGVIDLPAAQAVAKNVAFAFQDAGICMTYMPYPTARLAHMMANNRLYMDIVRSQTYLDVKPDTVTTIPEPLARVQGMMIVKDASLDRLDKVKDKDIAGILGMTWSDRLLRPFKHVTRTHNEIFGLKMLRADRIAAFFLYSPAWVSLQQHYPDLTAYAVMELNGYMTVQRGNPVLEQRIYAALRAYKSRFGDFVTSSDPRSTQ